jgi:ribosomal protein L37E
MYINENNIKQEIKKIKIGMEKRFLSDWEYQSIKAVIKELEDILKGKYTFRDKGDTVICSRCQNEYSIIKKYCEECGKNNDLRFVGMQRAREMGLLQ